MVVVKLRRKMGLFYGLILSGALLGLMLLGKMAGNALRKSAEQRLQASAELFAHECKKGIGYKLNQLRLLASLKQMADAVARTDEDPSAASSFLKDLVKYEGGRRSVYLFDLSGSCVACDILDEVGQSQLGTMVYAQPYVQAALSGTPGTGATVFSQSTGRPILPMAAPVRHDGSVIGVLWSSIDMGTLEKYMFGADERGRCGSRYLVLAEPRGAERVELNISDPNPTWTPPPSDVQHVLQKARGTTYHFMKKEATDLLFASARVPGTEWMVVVSRSMAEVLAPVYSLQKVGLAIILLLLGTLFGVTQWLLSPVIRGIETCRRFSEQIRTGRLDERLDIKTRDEVGELGSDLNAMAIVLEKSHRERESKLLAEEKLHQTERALSEMELHMLRFQLNPHFLFNALNSIHVLVAHEPQQAQTMICRLADFCRATLFLPDNGLSTIESEMELLEHYLAIERMRWANRLQVNLTVAPEVRNTRIPVFTLQLLVENAIKYGQLSGSDPLQIRVNCATRNQATCIEVANTGRWFEPATRDGSIGVGLSNLQNRLSTLYDAESTVETSEADGWVTVRILLPQRNSHV